MSGPDSPITPLDIKVIYDASLRGRSPARRAIRPAQASRARRGVLLGGASVLVAILLYYLTWWQVDREIYLRLLMHTPVEGVRTEDLSQMFGIPPESPPRVEPVRVGSAAARSPRTVQVMLGVTSYGWLTLSTLSACCVALFGAASIARGIDADLRRIGMILGGGVLLGLAYGVAIVWADYGWRYEPRHLRLAMSAPVALAASLGMAYSSRLSFFARIGGIALVVAAIGSVVALWLGNRCGAVEADHVSVLRLIAVFIAHSAWGWVILLLGARSATSPANPWASR